MDEALPDTFLAGLHQLGLQSIGAGEGSCTGRLFASRRMIRRGGDGGDRYARIQDLPAAIQHFLLYRQELLDWNTRFNLTAITNPEEILFKHFLDSLSLLLVYKEPQARLLDIGAG